MTRTGRRWRAAEAASSGLAAGLVCLALILLPGCGERSDPEWLAAAQRMVVEHDSAAAMVELKNLLQRNPNSAAARLLLGKLMFESGDPAGAEVELRRALAAGQADNEVLPLLAQVMLSLRQPAQLVAQYGKAELTDKLAAAELKTQLAVAQLALGAREGADQALDQALQRVPEHVPALVLRARLRAGRGETAAALSQADELLARLPGDAEAWLLKADLLLNTGASAPALEAYRRALALRPDLLAAHLALLKQLIRQRDYPAATLQWSALHKAWPRHPLTLQFEALLALQSGDAKRTQEICQLLLRGQAENPQLLFLAGQAEFKLGALAKAESLFAKAVQLAPRATAPRLLLAEVYLRSGQAEKALASLKPLLDDKAGSADALSVAARAQMLAGDAQAAEASLLRAAKLKPADSRIRTAAALSQLGKGRDNEVFAELEALAQADGGGAVNLALFNARLARNDFDGALKALDALAAKQTEQALPDYLRGRVALQRDDPAAARKHFEAALAKQADYFPALSRLAALDAREGRADAARARLEAALQSAPDNSQALMMLAALGERAGADPQEVGALLQDAVKAQPADARARAALIDHQLATGGQALALAAAQSAVAAVPNDPGLLDRLGRLQQDSGDLNQALISFTQMASLQPKAALPLLRLAEVQLAARNIDAAASSVQRAMDIEPDSLLAQRSGVIVALRRKHPAQALAIARKVQSQRTDEAVGFMLEAEIELAQDHGDSAVTAYRQALAKPDGAEAALRLHALLLKTRQSAEADQLAEQWLKDHPQDAVFLSHLGTAAMSQDQLALAETRFRDVLKLLPDNPAALNNLAFALVRQHKPGAVAIAESAVKLAPDAPALLDTLAQAYAEENQLDKAIRTQAKAVDMAPQDGALRLTLVKLNLRAGVKDSAQSELDKLTQLGRGFAGQEEVERLRKQIGLAPVSPATAPPPARPSSRSRDAWSQARNVAMAAGVAVALAFPLLLLIAARRPPAFVVKREIAIDAPVQRVFDLLQDLKQWEHWSGWPQFGPAMSRRFNQTAGRGAYCTWQDKRRHAEGSVEIVALHAPSKLVIELTFSRPDEAIHLAEIALATDPAGATRVQWTARGPAPFWQRVAGVLRSIDKRVGKSLSADLARLKAAAEAAPAAQQVLAA